MPHEHTEGPWSTFRDPTLNVQGIKGGDGRTVFDVGWGDDGRCPGKADAMLMAAAPLGYDLAEMVMECRENLPAEIVAAAVRFMEKARGQS